MKINLETDQIWNEITRVVTQIDVDGLAREHLEACQYRIEGYWDGEEFYEAITLSHSLDVALGNVALSRNTNGHGKACLLKLTFLLSQDDEEFGQMLLIFDSKMEFIDENWSIDVDSPYVVIESIVGQTVSLSSAN
jgi:hypothetical protein